jgi:putative transcriptional regulator
MDDPASRRIDEERAAVDARTEEELEAAARKDPDNPPIDPAEFYAALAREDARDVYGVARLRRKLGMAQIVFSARYGIPLQTLRQWERGLREPDTAAKSLLAVIEAFPEQAAVAIERARTPAKAA